MRKPVVKDRIYRYLLQKLASGEWQSGQPLPSLRRTSYELRVSHQPVHLVWQEAAQSGLLTRNAAGETIATPNAAEMARAILADIAAKARTKRLAILLPGNFSIPLSPSLAPLQAQLVHAVIQAGAERGYKCQLISMKDNDQLDQASSIAHAYDAAFVVELSPQYLATITHMAECGLPTLVYQRQIPGIRVPSLITDDYSAAKRLAELFISRGHRNICLVTTLHCESIMDERMLARRGWLEALESAGIIDQCVMPVFFGRDPGFSLMIEKLLTLKPAITGLAIGLLGVTQIMAASPRLSKIRIPEDLSLAATGTVGKFALPPGFPPITCFEIDWPRAGQCAIEMLDKLIAGESDLRNIRVPLQLQLTDSLGPPCASST